MNILKELVNSSFFYVFYIYFIGDYMFNIGDYVTRNSYNNDIVFKIIGIENDIYYLKGMCIRLYADSYKDDLVLCEDYAEKDKFMPSIDEYRELNRNEYFYLPGRILHLDGDREYLEKCLSFYKKNKIKAYGFFMKETEMINQVNELLTKYNPDILVLTGHDSFSRTKRNKYKNTSSFVSSVLEARKYEKSHEKLFIIAGACQSNYEDLIKAGANFASSPKRINIHALDPAIVASRVSLSEITKDIDLKGILEGTKYGKDGMGGIITKGTMYVGYPR